MTSTTHRIAERRTVTARWAWALTGLLLLLGGCATTVTSQVTAFHDQTTFENPRTYAFQRAPAQQNNLEHQTYEGWLAPKLAAQGFVPASAHDAHYLVAMQYGVRQQFARVSQPVYDPMFAPGPWGPWGPYDPWFWGPPAYIDTAVPITVKWLELRFLQRVSGKEVYRVSAQTADGDSLTTAMPYLINAALTQMPLPSGRTLRFDETVPPKH